MVHIMAFTAALALYRDVNTERTIHGLRPLVLDARLAAAAEKHAVDMVRRRYFDHVSPAGDSPADRLKEAGCSFNYAGENIAFAPDVQTADSALFGSPPHRENTLSSNYNRVGIGVAADANGDLYFVEDFSN
ncbi:MAG TPA: CAP domain-containing protein [Candidatus Baltobacteraceae bacterium]|nr:CAP domain-containing protein [Candidatus Baltobacteraceae bacterium]